MAEKGKKRKVTVIEPNQSENNAQTSDYNKQFNEESVNYFSIGKTADKQYKKGIFNYKFITFPFEKVLFAVELLCIALCVARFVFGAIEIFGDKLPVWMTIVSLFIFILPLVSHLDMLFDWSDMVFGKYIGYLIANMIPVILAFAFESYEYFHKYYLPIFYVEFAFVFLHFACSLIVAIAYTKINNVVVPKGVTKINIQLLGYEFIKNVELPNTLIQINEENLKYLYKLENIIVDANNKYYKAINGVLFNKDATKLIHYPRHKKDISYEVLNGVTSIGSEAFYNCESLKNVVLPNSITFIGDHAFYNCYSLESITFNGTINQWQKIYISAKSWETAPDLTVVCNNGTCNFSETVTHEQ